jgi:hypothetical protein
LYSSVLTILGLFNLESRLKFVVPVNSRTYKQERAEGKSPFSPA